MNKKSIVFLALGILVSMGCARVRVEAPKDPIKVDISMRLDIYQHIEKDIDAIEDIVSGAQKQETNPGNGQSLLNYLCSVAYAEEGLSPEVQEAALRRKDRYVELKSLMSDAIIGENKSGLLELRDKKLGGESVAELIQAENSDRIIIYKSVAQKNNSSVEAVQELYAKRLQKDAPLGTPLEVYDGGSSKFVWRIKQ